MYAVKATDLTKKFGRVTAVNALTLQVEKGCIYGLLGPNGAGKTTTIKLLLGLLRPDSGSIEMLEADTTTKSLDRIGYMPQESALYLENTVDENLTLFGEIYGLDSAERAENKTRVLSLVGLKKWKKSLVSHLSGGMKHRLSLACAMIHQPSLLFLDEPTVGVDPELRVDFWDYFQHMAKENVTIVITTHYMDEAQRCSTVGMLREGKLIDEGAPRALLNKTGTESLEDAFLSMVEGGNR